MIKNIVMPKVAPIMRTGKITEIMVDEGEIINKGDIILSLTAQKANVDIEAPIDGYIILQCEVGGDYAPGATLAYMASTLEELNEGLKEDEEKQVEEEKQVDNEENNQNLNVIELDSVKQSMVENMELTKEYVKGTTFMDVDFHEIKELRKIKKHSYTSYIAYAVSRALKKYPLINSTFSNNKIYVNKNINLGVAVDDDGRLYVPVIKNADTLSIEDMEEQIKSYQDKVISDSIAIEDLSDGTFTLTNSGIFGSLTFSPVMNYPQSGILGMGKIADKPVALNNEIVIRPIMIMSLSYDHRIIAGSVAVKFLALVKEMLENPEDSF